MLLLGILVCLASAVVQTLSFVSSRRFIVDGHGNPFRLLAMGHVLMGLLAAVVLPFFWAPLLLDWSRWLGLTLAASGFYLLGQAFFMIALRRSDSSRVAPLLALKMPAVAVVAILLLNADVNIWQWAAVGISVAAAFVLNRIGDHLPKPTVFAVLFAVCNFALCDVVIVRLIEACGEGFPAAARAVCVTYVLCGLGALTLLPWIGTRKPAAWRTALPYACAWFPSMFLFYVALSLIGPVLGNIVVSTRGLWAIVLGALIAHAGHHHLEQHVEKRILVRRFLAAAMMVAAIGLYVTASDRTTPNETSRNPLPHQLDSAHPAFRFPVSVFASGVGASNHLPTLPQEPLATE